MGLVNPQDFYSQKWEDSVLETATIQDVHYTLIPLPIPGGDPLLTQQVQLPQFSCKIITDQGKEFDSVSWLNPYLNPRTGSGLYVVPKKQTKVLIAMPKKGNPVILGFLAPVGGMGSYTNKREPMPPGSMMMKVDQGAKIQLLEGGVIRLQSTPVCKRTFLPSGDQIRDFCRNYYLITSGGELTWTESRDGQRQTALRIEAFQKGGADPGKSVRLQIGSHGDNDPDPTVPEEKIFSMVVNKDTQIYIGSNGRIMIRNHQPDEGEANDISIESDGKFTLANIKDIMVSAEDGKVTILAGSGGETMIEMKPDGDVNIKSATKVTISAPQVTIDSPLVRTTNRTLLGGGGLPVARMLDQVLVQTADGPATGQIMGGSSLTSSG